MYYILNENKEPVRVGMEEWGKWCSVVNNKVVRKSDVNGIQISTVFLGMKHAGGMFETMLFAVDDITLSEEDGYYQTRCETYVDALVMHNKGIAYVVNNIIGKKNTPSIPSTPKKKEKFDINKKINELKTINKRNQND